jgi:hypothetical protein
VRVAAIETARTARRARRTESLLLLGFVGLCESSIT